MPAGGLFSTAPDVGRFCQMMLRGGEWEGKRYLSGEAIKELTSKQTGMLKEGYGLGWSVGGGSFGHGGALATNMNIDTKRGLVTVYLIQEAGGFIKEGDQAHGAFKKAAEALYGKKE